MPIKSILAVLSMAVVNLIAEFYFAKFFNAAFPSPARLAGFHHILATRAQPFGQPPYLRGFASPLAALEGDETAPCRRHYHRAGRASA